MLEVRQVTKSFGGVRAVDGCSLSVSPRAITALIGPNGAGKTTLFDIIVGVVPADGGEVRLDGRTISGLPVYQRARHGIARTFQSVRLFTNLTVADNCWLAVTTGDDRLWSGRRRRDDAARLAQHERIRETLQIVGLNQPMDTPAADLSYGQGKLLELTRALLAPHRLLLLDEPVAGVTPPLRESLKDVLRELKARGETILLIEHDMRFVFGVADTVIVMNAGKVLRSGSPKEIQHDPEVLQAYLGGQL